METNKKDKYGRIFEKSWTFYEQVEVLSTHKHKVW
jgi:hypothetical protein